MPWVSRVFAGLCDNMHGRQRFRDLRVVATQRFAGAEEIIVIEEVPESIWMDQQGRFDTRGRG
jgi:hypothetical protein